MKRVLAVVGLTVFLVALVFGLCLACDAILTSASAMTVDMPDSGYVGNNLFYLYTLNLLRFSLPHQKRLR